MNTSAASRLTQTRLALRQATHADENRIAADMLADFPLGQAERDAIVDTAHAIVTKSREMTEQRGTLDAFMQEFGLSNQEGVALMCLAEALLRIPNAETQDALIAEKIASGNWADHRGSSEDLFVNAGVWALMLTGGVIRLDDKVTRDPAGWTKSAVARMSGPVIRKAVMQAMRIMGHQFVFGRTIKEALKQRSRRDPGSRLFSFDMLGEGARTVADAERHQDLYRQVIEAVGKSVTDEGDDINLRSSISIKLSALHPRYEAVKHARVMQELLPKVKELALLAKKYNMQLTVDAEEADRLDISLDIFESLARDGDLSGWQGLGLVVQAYQKRGPAMVDWLIALAEHTGRRFPTRLVKGAYWDSEIKHAQEMGFADYPVWTRKVTTDLCYLVCARRMFTAPQAFYPQFATHNAHSLAAVAAMGKGLEMEFQRLHGMGGLLYEAAGKVIGDMPRIRTYAPVGAHEDLLPYLVRRLLENGANSSFVNRFMDANVPVMDVVGDPVAAVAEMQDKRHSGIPVPRDLFGDRKNSSGLDLANPLEVQPVTEALAKRSEITYEAPSIVCGKAVGGEELPVKSPADNRILTGTYRHAEDADIDRALDAAVAAQRGWNALGGEKRAQILEKAADLIEEHRVALLDLLAREAGRVISDGISEIREASDFCRYYALQARLKFAEPMSLKSPTGESNQLSLHGRGVFFCISPWNFPLAIFTGQITAALASGNAVIAKPADPTPLVGAYAVRLLHEAGVPVEVLHLLHGRGSKMGAAVVADERVIGVALTGSTGTAQTINQSLAAKKGPINTLIAETGGQNVMIVDSSALPEQVTDDVMTSAFSSAGQRCSALRVLYLQDSIADKVIEMLKGALAERQIGNPLDLDTDVGPVINADARSGLEKHIDRMHREAKFIARGNLPDGLENGSYLAPHIFEIPGLSTLKDEEFGPILHVIRYSPQNIDKVMAEIGETGFGLTFGVHSRIEGYWLDLFRKNNVGNTYVNRNMIGAVVGVQPFGGMGLSGTGPKAGGPHYMLRFATEKILTINTAAIGGNTELFRLIEC
ncbi:MAG: bifunctional proline dehydrogenase/L-glutamate gamma-semialdehyde dehydrogenase PutA [Xanthomonadales bacterium]|nr:bifunctional proline dehydrogenase/L-glutamate gamma-semialdehyde dehydrogenase PutA [Gammaproteobacteria bacterium]NNK04623.1 bifunctional proline dehydrogenase/L-glutamate gamma-semialdehyde dehydrogenase PutA [Xanthomonadales bacterium]